MSNDFSAVPDLGFFSWDDLAPSLTPTGSMPSSPAASTSFAPTRDGVSADEMGTHQGGQTIPTLDEAHYGVAAFAPSDVPSDVTDRPSVDALLSGLNQQQHDAVVHEGEPLLIMAGAGSGKTRVLTHRIAYLLATGRARASEILAITFTNKAAAEMRERVEALVGRDARRMLVSTFHSACVRILRQEYRAAGLSSTFTIYDSQDSQRLLQIILKAHDVDTKRFTPKLVAARISDLKNELITPAQYADTHPNDLVSRVVSAAYTDYVKRLRQANAVDFDDLIMKTVQLLQQHPALAEHYHRRFRHILVDEYQDTNHAQYVLVRELVGTGDDGVMPAELTVVGDSDQSIYAFRGATIRNIEEFERDFAGARTILLEQNYRSTQTILSAANAVISRNEGRRPKNLWTDSGEGSKIVLDAAESDRDEARFVVGEIDRLGDAGVPWRDMAVFYRTNAQSRSIEELFVRQGIPYRVIGGTRFYERQEIKDALAYLQAIANSDDTVALRRIVNTPRRGVGAKAEAALAAHADRFGVSFGGALADVWAHHTGAAGEGDRPAPEGLSAKARAGVSDLWGLLMRLRRQESEGVSVADILDEMLDQSGYLAQLRASEDPQDASRVENLAELHSVAQDFVADASGAGAGRLVDFLERISLVADSDQLAAQEGDAGQVTLMTVHTAKGLEFPVVFVTGLEDGTFPHQRSLSDPSELAEERRLAYVAITRARERLYLSRAAVRSSWGAPQEMLPSRFLDDIPLELVDVRRSGSRSRGTGFGGGRAAGYGARGRNFRDDAYGEGSQLSPWDDDGAPAFGSGRSSAFVPGRLGSRQDEATRASSPGGGAPGRVGAGGGLEAESASEAVMDVAVGDVVEHRTLGRGTVVGVEGAGRSLVAKVRFDVGEKRLLVRMAPMKRVS